MSPQIAEQKLSHLPFHPEYASREIGTWEVLKPWSPSQAAEVTRLRGKARGFPQSVAGRFGDKHFIFRGLSKLPLPVLKITPIHLALKTWVHGWTHSHHKHPQASLSGTSFHSCQGTCCPQRISDSSAQLYFIYQPSPLVMENSPSSPQPNHIPISNLSKFSPPKSVARLTHLAPITPATNLPQPQPHILPKCLIR